MQWLPKPCSLLQKETVSRAYCSQFCLCTSLASRPVNVVFGLGIGLCMHMCTKLKNGVLHNGQQSQCYVIDQGKFEAMNMLSGCRVPCCDKHQLRAKVTVFEISSLNVVGFRYCALSHLAVF